MLSSLFFAAVKLNVLSPTSFQPLPDLPGYDYQHPKAVLTRVESVAVSEKHLTFLPLL